MCLCQLTHTLNLQIQRQSPEGMEPEGIIESDWNETAESFNDRDLSELLPRAPPPMILKNPLPSSSKPFFLVSRLQKAVTALGDDMGASCHACFGVPTCMLRCRSCRRKFPVSSSEPQAEFDTLTRLTADTRLPNTSRCLSWMKLIKH